MTPSKAARLRLLSPAARKLIDHKSGLSDRALTASYSPRFARSRVKTPGGRSKLTPIHHTPSLTDDLLNISHSSKTD